MKLYLGIAKADITPKIGTDLYGYGGGAISTAINDGLNVTVFVFRQGDVRCAFIAADLCAVGWELGNDARNAVSCETGIPFENIMICCSHTHTGPATKLSPGWGDVDRDACYGIFIPRLVQAAKEADSKMVAVKVGYATGESFIGSNRREWTTDGNVTLGQNPWGCFNPKMTVMSFKDEEDKIVGTLVHYGMHGTAAGHCDKISRDWPGVMVDALSEVTGAPAAFFNGPEGDVGPRLSNGSTTGKGDIKYIYEIGHKAAADAISIFNKISDYREVEFAVKYDPIKMPIDKRIPFEQAEEQLAEFKNLPNRIGMNGLKLSYYNKIVDSYKNGYEDKEFDYIPAHIMRIGDIVFVTSPYEVFSEIGLRIQKDLTFPLVLICVNTNGSAAYFPTCQEILRGGYEITHFKLQRIQPFTEPADQSYIDGIKESVASILK